MPTDRLDRVDVSEAAHDEGPNAPVIPWSNETVAELGSVEERHSKREEHGGGGPARNPPVD